MTTVFTDKSIDPADTFYSSSIENYGNDISTFNRKISNKTRFDIQFAVNNSVRMLSLTSSIMNFSHKKKQWTIPTASLSKHVGPFAESSFSFPTLGLGTSEETTWGSKFFEDYKGFDPYGLPFVRGNNTEKTNSQTDRFFNRTISFASNAIEEGSSNTEKSFPTSTSIKNQFQSCLEYTSQRSHMRDSIFFPDDEDTFSISEITSPFLIEKINLTIPIALGNNWFNDRTVTCLGDWIEANYRETDIDDYASQTLDNNGTGISTFYDAGGPTLTFAMFCKRNFGTSSLIELIASGTVTHVSDSFQTIDVRCVFSQSIPLDTSGSTSRLQVTPVGNPFATNIIIDDNSYTGSIAVKMEAGIWNGFTSILSYFENTSNSDENSLKEYVNNKMITDWDTTSPGVYNEFEYMMHTCKPFGRSGIGMHPAGSSIFGREFISRSAQLFTRDVTQYHLSSSTMISEVNDKLSSLLSSFAIETGTSDMPDTRRISRINMMKHATSPYLVYPGDRFFITVSKTRPAISASSFGITGPSNMLTGEGTNLSEYFFTGSSGHDVQLITGTINLSLFGSYIRNGNAIYV